MQKDEVKRIMKLVQEGKLSPEDAAELIEAFEEDRASATDASGATPPPPPPQAGGASDPFQSIAETIERIGRDVAKGVNWQDISSQIRVGAQKGAEALKTAVEEAKLGKFSFSIFGAQETKTVNLPIHVPEGKTLRIENLAGDVKVIGGAAGGELIAEAHVRGHDAEDARAKAEAYTPIIEEGEGFISIRQAEMSGLSVDIEVRVMNSVNVEVKSRAGDVEIRSTAGACRVNGSSGDIRVSGVSGPVDIHTASGDVDLHDSESPNVIIENTSGSMRLLNVRGPINLRTASGDVTLESCAGRTISVEAVSGDASVDISEPINGTVNVRTVSGDVLLTVPDGNDCRVQLASMTGHVDCLLNLSDLSRADRRVTGQLGHGAGTVDVSAISGGIRVRQRVHA
jgi:DUF4097 and DUF4098 domain-containing protein YvlB